MASQQIDELQLKIGSDATSAITQLGNLSAALSSAASNARSLAGATGFLSNFGAALSRVSNINMDKTIAGLKTLQRMDLSNLKDKTIKLDFQISGADQADRLRYATANAAKSVQKDADAIAKSLSSSFDVNTEGAKEIRSLIRGMVKEMANGGSGTSFAEPLFQSVYENTQMVSEKFRDLEKEAREYIDWFNGLKIDPKGIEDWESWSNKGFQRILKTGGIGIDKLFEGEKERIQTQFSSLFQGVDVSAAQDLFSKLAEAYQRAQSMIGSAKNDDRFQSTLMNSIEVTYDKVRSAFDESVSKSMVDTANKIPIDLDIDQNRFEQQIQKAINAATGKVYEHTPVKINIDTQTLRNNISESLKGIDVGQLPQFADRFKTVSDAVSQMNGIKLQDTGIVQFTNALRRLSAVDMTKFDASAFDGIVAGVSSLAQLGNISNGLNRFVSAMARLANAGDNTTKTANGLKVLTPEMENTVKAMQNVGSVDETLNSFIASLAKLATAGDKAQDTANSLAVLRDAVVDFLNAMSNAPAINENIAQTIQGLGNLAQAGSKTGTVMRNLGQGTGGGGNFMGMLKQSANTTASALKSLLNASLSLGGKGASAVGSFFRALGLIPGHADNVDRLGLSFTNLFRAVVPFYGLSGIFNWLKEAVQTGSSIVEVENVVNTMFGTLNKGYEDLTGLVYKWAQGTIDAFGVSELAARQYAGKLMAMFSSSGLDATEGMRDKAAEMSMNLVQLAGDLASFYDIDVDEVMTKIQAGIAGMNRPLRSLGINLSVANMQQHALTMGITESWKNMDQATQMLVRYDYLMNAAQYAVGDFSRTSHTFANEVRVLGLNFQVLSATIGQGLISAIAPAITWINALIRRLIQAANAFRTFMFTIFGKAIGAAKGVVNDLAGYADDASDALGGIGDSGGGLGGAAKSAKELAKQLSVLPFDELNQLAKDTSSAGSGGGSGSGGGGGVGGLGDLWGDSFLDATDLDGSEMADAISEWGAKIKAAFEAQDWVGLGSVIAEGINSGFERLNEWLDYENWRDKVEGFIHPFQTTINSMMDGISWDLIGTTFSTGLNTITYILDDWFTGFHFKDWGADLATAMNSALDGWDAGAFGRMIADKFNIAWSFFSGWTGTFKFDEAGQKLKEALINMLDTVEWDDIGSSTGEFLTGIGDMLKNIFEDDKEGGVREKLKSGFSTMLDSFFKTFDAKTIMEGLGSAASSIIGGLGDALIEHKDEIKDSLSTFFEELPWDVIFSAASGVFALAFAKQMIGAALKTAIVNRFGTLGLGSALGLGGAGAAGAAGAAGGAAGAVGGAGAAGLSLGSVLGITGLTVAITSLSSTIKKYSPEGIAERQHVENTITEPNAVAWNTADAGYGTKYNPSFGSASAGATPKTSSQPTASPKKQVVTTVFEGILDKTFTASQKAFDSVQNETKTKTMLGLADPSLHKEGDYYHGIVNDTATKIANGIMNSAFVSLRDNYHGIYSNTAVKTAEGDQRQPFLLLMSNWHGIYSNSATKTAYGDRTTGFNTMYDRYVVLKDKDVYIDLKKGNAAPWTAEASGLIAQAFSVRRGQITWNAAGGLFTRPTVMQGFGEAGPEAALPLRNKKSMSMIASAITKSGGYGGNIDADRIARTIAAAVISAVTSQGERPVNVNAVLYTENNEVLARAVDAGRRSIDKRYNPVSKMAYS